LVLLVKHTEADLLVKPFGMVSALASSVVVRDSERGCRTFFLAFGEHGPIYFSLSP
jgi:hypothetical protein